MALTTARQYHIDDQVISRAQKLLNDFDAYCRPNKDAKDCNRFIERVEDEVADEEFLPRKIDKDVKMKGDLFFLMPTKCQLFTFTSL
jgi:hypothetical protein